MLSARYSLLLDLGVELVFVRAISTQPILPIFTDIILCFCETRYTNDRVKEEKNEFLNYKY